MAEDFYGYQSELDYIAQEEEETKRKEEEAARLLEEHRERQRQKEEEKAARKAEEAAREEEERKAGTLDQPDVLTEEEKKKLIPIPTEEEFEEKEKELYDYEKEMEEHKKELTDYKERLSEHKKEVFERIARKVEEERKEAERKQKEVPSVQEAYKKVKTPEDADRLVDKLPNETNIKKREKLERIALQPKVDNQQFDAKEKEKERKLKEAERELAEAKKEEIEKDLMPYYKKTTKMARGANSDNARLKRIMKLTESGNDLSAAKATLAESVGDAIGVDLSGLVDVDALELRSLSIDFMRNIKATIGTANITNTEVEMYMSTVPNLMQSPEGRLRVAQNNMIMNMGNILKKNAMDKIIEDNDDVIPEDIEQRVDDMVKDRKAMLSKLFVDGVSNATQDVPFEAVDPERLERIVTFKKKEPEVAKESPAEYITRRREELREMSSREARQKGIAVDKEVQRQADTKRLSLKRVLDEVKTPEDLDRFTSAMKYLPAMDKQENRDKLARAVMQKRFEMLDKKEIKERNDAIEKEFQEAERKRIKVRAIEEDREYAEEKMADKISQRTGIDDPFELKRLSKKLLGEKVSKMKKEIEDAVRKKIGLGKDEKPTKQTRERFMKETKKLSQDLMKARQSVLQGEKEKRAQAREERARQLTAQKKELQKEKKVKKETVPYYKKMREMTEATEAESDTLKRILTISELGDLSHPTRVAIVNKLKKGVKVTFPFKFHAALDLTRALTADTQEMQKLSTSFMKNVKEILGTSRITQREIEMYLKSVPNEMMTQEGRRRVINQKLRLNKINKIRKEAADAVIKEYGGLGKIKLDKLEREIDKRVKDKEQKIIRKFIDAIPTKFVRQIVKRGEIKRKKQGPKKRETLLFG